MAELLSGQQLPTDLREKAIQPESHFIETVSALPACF
jgi:hypothetical protein